VNVVDSRGELLPLVDIIRQLEQSGATTADMMTIFGLEAGPAMQALVSQGSDALGNLTRELENSGGTAEQIASTQMEGLNGAVMGLKSAVEGLMLAIADTGLLDAATRLVERLTSLTQSAGNANPALLKTATVIGGVAAAAGPAVWVTGKLASGLSTTAAVGARVATTTALLTGRTLMLIPAVNRAVAGYRNMNLAFAANATLSTRLGAALRSQILLWRQQAAAAGVSTARIILVSAATKIWAAAQWLLNAAMRANPIGLIITGIMLLVGAAVLAYKRFDWFRNIVDSAWSTIRNAAAAAWEVIGPILTRIASVLVTVVGTALRWYAAYARFVFTTVWTIIKTAWAIIQPIF